MATPMFSQPGWVGLVANRHVEHLDELTADELAGFGMVAAQVQRAITEVTGSRKVYLWMFGDRAPHLHAVQAPKPRDPPSDHIGPGLAVHRADYADPERAAEVTAALQRVLLGDLPNQR
jgi:diadenosine tetraphosphate (Ap4A) HIT family hydrolase